MKSSHIKRTVLCVLLAALIISAAIFAAFTMAERSTMTGRGALSGGAALSPMEGYYLKTTGGDMIVCKDGPCVMRNESGNDGVFDGLRNGDRIEVTYEYVLETYPGKMPVYSCKLLERGSIEDIPEDVLENLSELGWYEENE